MEKFSKLKPKTELSVDKDDVLYDGGHLSVVSYEDWTVVKESDFVVCIIYLIEENQFILRNEYIPTFKMVDGQEYHITVLSGTMKEGETPERTLLREIEEEAGIVIRPDFKIEFMKPLFISKAHASKYHPAIITLTERDFHEVIAKGDGSKAEKMSQTIKLDKKYINSVNASDLITEYMMVKFKEYLNI
jgi:8-oxo-dGTP pyrophosphatase MutT (NUDIX family)